MIRITDTRTPVVVLHCGLGALAIMRTLGRHGIDVYGVNDTADEHSLKSRYCRKSYVQSFATEDHEQLKEFLCTLSDTLSERPILIAASDETAIFVAKYYEELSETCLIAQNGGQLVKQLADKKTMFELAGEQNIPAPRTHLLFSLGEAKSLAMQIGYPVMLKGVMGNKLYEKTGKKMVIVHDEVELSREYTALEDPDDKNLMMQEMVPGGDDQVYIFNGYFDRDSDCLVGFTGRKIRQYPIHVGCASLGECCWDSELYELTTSFMKRIGYTGILDIGYRKDPRDQTFKVLDINPRVGQAFRIFVSPDNVDVVVAMYLDLTGQPVPRDQRGREGRRWVIEDFDLISFLHYRNEKSITFLEWIKSFRRLEEGAWFSWRDPLPFLLMTATLSRKFLGWIGKKFVPNDTSSATCTAEPRH